MATSSRTVPQLELSTPLTPSPSQTTRPRLGTNGTTSRTVTSQRLPPPTLFQGPPSKNASHISLALPGESHKKDTSSHTPHTAERVAPRPSRVPAANSFSAGSTTLRPPPTQADDFRAESLWAEMQKTLADVELSAMNPSHVFGEGHARALEDLRNAQLGLAQAWAKSAQDESDGLGEGRDEEEGKLGVVGQMGTSESPATGKGEGAAKTSFANNKNLEEETERDIKLARKRREANDRYFSQVNRGVLDVVGRLDEVANAMRRVEKESREIWESDDGLEGAGSGDGEVTDTDASAMADSPVEAKERR